MKNYILFTLIYLISFGAFAQSSGLAGSGSSQDFFQSVDNYFVRDKSLAELNASGTPYIEDEFLSARFKRFGNRIYSVRFNAYTNDIEVQSEKGTINVNKNQDFEVTFLQSNVIYKNYDFTNNGNTRKVFFVVLSENDNYSLLKLEKIRFRAAEGPQHGYDKGKGAAFLRENDEFYLKVDGKMSEIPTRKKRFLQAFPEQESELKKYMKKEKLNPNDEQELIKLVTYAMSLTNS